VGCGVVIGSAQRWPIHLATETRRWQRSLVAEMAHADTRRIGAACTVMADARTPPRRPDPAEVFELRWLG